MKELIIYTAWIGFAIFSGLIESILFYYKGFSKRKYSIEHFILTAQRIMVAIPLVYFLSEDFVTALLSGLSLIAMFPFFHDGFYYIGRNWIDGAYPLGFMDYSKTDTALFSFDFMQRVLTFVLSLLFILILNI